MPRISADQAYGVGAADQRLTFRERLMKRFAAHEWVRIINVDSETFKWQYLPARSETVEFTPDPMKMVYREEVEAYALEPGESEVIIGENAYVMIEALYKKIVAKRMIAGSPDQAPSLARNFNWNDATAQEEWIDRIYLGKEQPKFGNTPVKKAEEDVVKRPTITPRKSSPQPIRMRTDRPSD